MSEYKYTCACGKQYKIASYYMKHKESCPVANKPAKVDFADLDKPKTEAAVRVEKVHEAAEKIRAEEKAAKKKHRFLRFLNRE